MINEFRPMNHLTSLQNLICTVGNLPTSYALSLSYEEQIWWLCDFLEKKVFPAIEENTNITEETQASFIELQNYVRDYFNNLDVQEEINNKLDEMTESGELAEIIDEYFNTKLEFYAVAKSSATYVVKFKNGKTMFIDTGKAEQWDDIKIAIAKLGITHFDYGIITHFHSDHHGNLQNFITEYGLDNNTKIWVQMKPDFFNHSEDLTETEANYDNQIAILTSNGITPIVPVNDSYFEIDTDTKLHFLNTSQEWAEDYYGQITEYYETGINFNHFSLVTEILHKDVSILATGDIEKAVEDKLVNYIHQCEVMTAPHHMVNRDANLQFYRSAKTKWAIGMYISNNINWLRYWYKSPRYLLENGAKLVTPQMSIPDDNYCYSFYSNGKTVTTTVKGAGDNPDNAQALLYDRAEEVIDYNNNLEEDITLRHLMENMRRGSILNIYIYAEFISQKVQLYNDLVALFPKLASGWVVTIQKGMSTGNNLGYSQISATNGYLNYVAKQTVNDRFEFKVSGFGQIREITGESNLIAELNVLPQGSYNATYKDTESKFLNKSAFYDVSIYKSSDINSVKASFFAVLKNGYNNQHSDGIFAGYYDSTLNNPAIRWYRLGNSNNLGSANGMTNLITYLKGLKTGHYIMRYYNDDSGFLESGGYDLSINISQSIDEDNVLTASILATQRTTNADDPTKKQVCVCYINATTETSNYVWHKINN